MMKKSDLKVNIIVKYFYPVTAGIETNIDKTYQVLAKNGWDVVIHTSSSTYLKKNHLPKKELINGMVVNRYDWNFWGYWPKINWSENEIVALHNFDIFPHFWIMIYFLLRKTFHLPTPKLFLTPHGGYNPEWSVFSLIEKMVKYTYTYTLGTWLINKSVDGLRAISEWELHEMIKRGIKKEKISIIENGLEDEAFLDIDALASQEIKNKTKQFGRYLFENARLYKIKDIETLIKALPLIAPDIKLVIVGSTQDQNYVKSLLNLAKELNVENRLILFGNLYGIDKYYLGKHALMFVHMALWESYGNVIKEAKAMGKVCLVADNYAQPFLIKNGKNGFLISTGDHRALAERINFVLDKKNIKLIQSIETTNLIEGRENRWSDVATKTNQVYRQLLGNNE